MRVDLPSVSLSILEEVKQRTGKPVLVQYCGELEVGYAKTKIARKRMTSHIILVSKKYAQHRGYLVAHECGHILRVFATPEEKRKVPIMTEQTRRYAIEQMQSDIHRLARVMPEQLLTQMLQLWCDGLVTQVTSQPADVMIENWIYHEHPDLRLDQKKILDLMHREAAAALRKEIAQLTPTKVYTASLTMNYAFFGALDELLGTSYLEQFKSCKYAAEGERLKEMLLRESWDTLEGDIAMSNAWAEALGISGWFEWTDFENLPANYLDDSS